jgi:hypothetical protein
MVGMNDEEVAQRVAETHAMVASLQTHLPAEELSGLDLGDVTALAIGFDHDGHPVTLDASGGRYFLADGHAYKLSYDDQPERITAFRDGECIE